MTHPPPIREAALYLLDLGLNDCQTSRVTGIPRSTVREWRRPVYFSKSGRPRFDGEGDCPVCFAAPLDEQKYAYLLGLYLGDGWLRPNQRGVFRLEIYCCEDYLHLLIECADAMAAMRPGGKERTGFYSRDGCIKVYSDWKHWPCLFPQTGSGPKHLRSIVLENWQEEIVRRDPRPFLRGLIHSDGWRGRNQGRGKNGKLYYYSRYEFTNNSAEIRALFASALDQLGIHHTQTNWNRIAISRRGCVAKLDTFIGPKT